MSHLKKSIAKKRAQARRMKKTPKQEAQDNRFWACGRKRYYSTRAEANIVAQQLQHTVYACVYCKGFHTAHIPGSQRFVRGAEA